MATAPEPPERSRPEMHANRFRASWRTELLAAVEDFSNQTNWLQYEGSGPKSQELLRGIRSQLDSASSLLAQRRGNTRLLVLAHVHAAQLDLLRLAPASYVRASMTDLWTQAQRSLATNDPRLDRLDALRQK